MVFKKIVCLGLLCLALRENLPAQKAKTLSFSVLPLNWYTGLIRLDAELYLKKSKHSLVVAPQYFTTPEIQFGGYGRRDDKSFFGAGIELQHKIYMDKIEEESDAYRSRMYFAYGFAYHSFRHRYETNTFYSYEDDGITYYTFGEKSTADRIQRYRASIYTGFQKRTRRFVFEAYAGVSYQFSSIEYENEFAVREYKKSILSYGYQGFTPRAGFKLGLFLF